MLNFPSKLGFTLEDEKAYDIRGEVTDNVTCSIHWNHYSTKLDFSRKCINSHLDLEGGQRMLICPLHNAYEVRI